MLGGSKSSAVVPPPSDTNFYLDDRDIQIVDQHNPFHLPPELLATTLFQCYFQTVHITFPIISSSVQYQLQSYYHSARRGESVTYPQTWFAIVHLVLAIGARFLRLTNAEWHSDPLDETVYLSSARQLMGLNDTTMVLATPDLPFIQVRFH